MMVLTLRLKRVSGSSSSDKVDQAETPALVRVSVAVLQSAEVSVQVEKNDATKLLLIAFTKSASI